MVTGTNMLPVGGLVVVITVPLLALAGGWLLGLAGRTRSSILHIGGCSATGALAALWLVRCTHLDEVTWTHRWAWIDLPGLQIDAVLGVDRWAAVGLILLNGLVCALCLVIVAGQGVSWSLQLRQGEKVAMSLAWLGSTLVLLSGAYSTLSLGWMMISAAALLPASGDQGGSRKPALGVDRVADAALMVALAAWVQESGGLDFPVQPQPSESGPPVSGTGALLLVLAVLTRAGQLPVHWRWRGMTAVGGVGLLLHLVAPAVSALTLLARSTPSLVPGTLPAQLLFGVPFVSMLATSVMALACERARDALDHIIPMQLGAMLLAVSTGAGYHLPTTALALMTALVAGWLAAPARTPESGVPDSTPGAAAVPAPAIQRSTLRIASMLLLSGVPPSAMLWSYAAPGWVAPAAGSAAWLALGCMAVAGGLTAGRLAALMQGHPTDRLPTVPAAAQTIWILLAGATVTAGAWGYLSRYLSGASLAPLPVPPGWPGFVGVMAPWVLSGLSCAGAWRRSVGQPLVRDGDALSGLRAWAAAGLYCEDLGRRYLWRPTQRSAAFLRDGVDRMGLDLGLLGGMELIVWLIARGVGGVHTGRARHQALMLTLAVLVGALYLLMRS